MKRFTVIVFSLLIICPLFGVDFSNAIPVYITHGNIFADFFFKEPVEVLVFITIGGDYYVLTNYKESFVAINYDEFKNHMKQNGYTIKDVMCVIHNHTGTLMKFSSKDLRFYNTLRTDGFKGLFLLWSSWRQRVTDMRYSQ